jgi:predicted transcriptional regulator
MDKPDKRPDHVTFRISPTSKARLQALATAERRPLSNLVALIVDEYLDAQANDPTGDKATKRKAKGGEAPAK